MSAEIPDLDALKEIPGYKAIMKVVLKTQIQLLVEQLCDHTGEESVILTASVNDGSLSHLGSDLGKGFLHGREEIKSQFLGYCLKVGHKKKTEETEELANRSNLNQPSSRMSQPQIRKRQRTRPVPLSKTPEASDPSYLPPALKKQFLGRTASEEQVSDILSDRVQIIKQDTSVAPDVTVKSESHENDTENNTAGDHDDNVENDFSSQSTAVQLESDSEARTKTEPVTEGQEEDFTITGFEMPEGASENWDQNMSGTLDYGSDVSFDQSANQSGYEDNFDPTGDINEETYFQADQLTEIRRRIIPHVEGSKGRPLLQRQSSGRTMHPCVFCAKPFRDKISLERHIRVHTGEKPFVCEVESCGKAFRQKIQLTIHMRAHSGERPFVCNTCGNCYPSMSGLNAHILRKHVMCK